MKHSGTLGAPHSCGQIRISRNHQSQKGNPTPLIVGIPVLDVLGRSRYARAAADWRSRCPRCQVPAWRPRVVLFGIGTLCRGLCCYLSRLLYLDVSGGHLRKEAARCGLSQAKRNGRRSFRFRSDRRSEREPRGYGLATTRVDRASRPIEHAANAIVGSSRASTKGAMNAASMAGHISATLPVTRCLRVEHVKEACGSVV
jgi:hypothetical protein